MAVLRHSTVDTIKSLLAATDSQHCVRLLEFSAGLATKSDVGHVHPNDHVALTIGAGNLSLSLAVNGSQVLTGEVRLGTTPGLFIDATGLRLDFGTGANQPARGNHVHANDHVAAVADPSQTNTATVTVSVDQKIKAAVVLKSGGGILSDSQGLYLNLGTGGTQAAFGNHTHAVATGSVAGFMSAADKTKLDGLSGSGPYTFTDTLTIDFTNTANVITADVRIGTGAGLKTVLGDGLVVDFAVVATAGHGHALATVSSAGFMSAADKLKLDGISGSGGGGPLVTIGGGNLSLSLVCGSDQIFRGEVRLNAGGGLKIVAGGLAADVGTGATQVAAGNHVHANDHVAAVADPSQTDSISVTVSSDQKIKASAILATGGGLKLNAGQGLAVSLGLTSTTVAAGNHTHAIATNLIPGFLSSADKVKLDGLASTAENPLTFPDSSTIDFTRTVNAISAAVKFGNGLKIGGTPSLEVDFGQVSPLVHVHDVATGASAGFMSAADKTRLDGLPDQDTLDGRYVLLQTGDPTEMQTVNTYLRANRLYLGPTSSTNFSVDIDNNIVADSNMIILGTLTVGALRLSSIYLLNTTSGYYVPITVSGAVDEQQFHFGFEVISAVGQLDVAYFLNATTGYYVPVTIAGAGDERQFVFGVEVPP